MSSEKRVRNVITVIFQQPLLLVLSAFMQVSQFQFIKKLFFSLWWQICQSIKIRRHLYADHLQGWTVQGLIVKDGETVPVGGQAERAEPQSSICPCVVQHFFHFTFYPECSSWKLIRDVKLADTKLVWNVASSVISRFYFLSFFSLWRLLGGQRQQWWTHEGTQFADEAWATIKSPKDMTVTLSELQFQPAVWF